MTGRTIVITGASDGIGAAAARALSAAGERVVVVGRSETKTKAVATELAADYFVADFADLSQVRTLAAALREKYPRIDVLANNAGGIMGRRELTVDGHEKTFQVNHLAPFLLTTLLMDVLANSGARVINTSSVANRIFARLDIEDLDAGKAYATNRAYGNCIAGTAGRGLPRRRSIRAGWPRISPRSPTAPCASLTLRCCGS
jgi:NAD(P)-dependent dehydrogenase (short-subunit alcohol dehydrogenase family)